MRVDSGCDLCPFNRLFPRGKCRTVTFVTLHSLSNNPRLTITFCLSLLATEAIVGEGRQD
jgi:hypothetical protein